MIAKPLVDLVGHTQDNITYNNNRHPPWKMKVVTSTFCDSLLGDFMAKEMKGEEEKRDKELL